MGATSSRSSPRTETLLLRIREYSKLMRAPVNAHYRDCINFQELRWYIDVSSARSNEEDTRVSPGSGSGSDLLLVLLFGFQNCLQSALRTDISIEILDTTGLHTVFQRESSTATMTENLVSLGLRVKRSELEASSCLRRHDDSFYVRFTVREKPRPSLLGNWFSSSNSDVSEEVAMARSHTLTVDSLPQLKSALLPKECAYSTRFAVGDSSWYLKLDPTLAVVRLVRATNEDDETRSAAEFSFTLQGAVNVKSEKMTHAFDRDNPDCEFAYETPGQKLSTSAAERLVVQCFVKVIPAAVVPTIPAATIRAPVLPPAESVLTPLLSAMHGGQNEISYGVSTGRELFHSSSEHLRAR